MATATIYLKNGDYFELKDFNEITSTDDGCVHYIYDSKNELIFCASKDMFSHMVIQYKEDAK